jgi:hypothetical protein
MYKIIFVLIAMFGGSAFAAVENPCQNKPDGTQVEVTGALKHVSGPDSETTGFALLPADPSIHGEIIEVTTASIDSNTWESFVTKFRQPSKIVVAKGTCETLHIGPLVPTERVLMVTSLEMKQTD